MSTLRVDNIQDQSPEIELQAAYDAYMADTGNAVEEP